MHDTLTPHRTQLLQSKVYAASPAFIQNVRWQYENNRHVLLDVSTGSNIVATVVGRVLEHRCGPNGNYLDLNSKYVTLATAKYQLLLGKPIGTPFALDYDKVLENVGSIQAQAASTNDRCNFIVADGINRNLRFTRKVFEKRDDIIARPAPPAEVYLEDLTDTHGKTGNLLDKCKKRRDCPDAHVEVDHDVDETMSDGSSDTAISLVKGCNLFLSREILH